jgi:ECF sigma factor
MPSPRDLLPQVYDELRRLAAAKPAHERPRHSLDATAPVHDAWLRLAEASVEWSRPIAMRRNRSRIAVRRCRETGIKSAWASRSEFTKIYVIRALIRDFPGFDGH